MTNVHFLNLFPCLLGIKVFLSSRILILRSVLLDLCASFHYDNLLANSSTLDTLTLLNRTMGKIRLWPTSLARRNVGSAEQFPFRMVMFSCKGD